MLKNRDARSKAISPKANWIWRLNASVLYLLVQSVVPMSPSNRGISNAESQVAFLLHGYSLVKDEWSLWVELTWFWTAFTFILLFNIRTCSKFLLKIIRIQSWGKSRKVGEELQVKRDTFVLGSSHTRYALNRWK